MDQSPTKQEIADALAASGFLMEQEVATALEGIGFHAETGRAYTDPDEGKQHYVSWGKTDATSSSWRHTYLATAADTPPCYIAA